MIGWEHDALAADLMDRRHYVGEIAIERLMVRGGQLDVAAMRLSWSRPIPTGYEVKISRADFLSDIRSEKWRNYMCSVSRLYFATPNGLVDAREIPIGCGLIVWGPRGWYVRKRAPITKLTTEQHARFVQALLFRHYPAPWDGPARMRDNLEFAARQRREGVTSAQ